MGYERELGGWGLLILDSEGILVRYWIQIWEKKRGNCACADDRGDKSEQGEWSTEGRCIMTP